MVSSPSVRRRDALALLCAAAFTGAAGPALSAGGVTVAKIDPNGLIRPALLKAAFAAAAAHTFKTNDRMAVVDFALHSSKPRLFLVDLKTGDVEAMRSAHGIGSDLDHDGYATVFNNVSGSGASSLGAYRVVGQGAGPKHGPHLALDGLDSSNDLARPRAIIIHAAWYAEPDFVKQSGKMGRSNGCFVTCDADLNSLFAVLKPGTLLYAGV
jgi:hypothetical protein